MRKFFAKTARPFAREEKGTTMLEYALIAGLIAIFAITGVTLFGGAINTAFTTLATSVTNGVNTAPAQ
jgi:Flp pilus assembly pilin Flp